MSDRTTEKPDLERYTWIALLASVATVPLAVTKLPFLDAPLTFDAFAFPQNVALALGAAVALVLWSAAVWTGRSALALARPMIPFALFIAWSAVATVAGYDPLRSLLGTSLSSLSLMNILAVSAVAFLASQSLGRAGRMRTLTWAVVASAAVVAVIALLQQLFGADVFGLPQTEGWVVGRGFSTLGNPDHLGTFLVLPVLLSAFLVLHEKGRNERIAAGASLAVLLAALTGTLTRGAWVAVAAGAVIAVGLLWKAGAGWRQRRQLVLVASICGVAILVALAASDYGDLGSRFSPAPAPVAGTQAAPQRATDNILSDRPNLWRSSLRVAQDRPLTGTGPAAYQLGWYPHAVAYSSAGGEGALADDPHSFAMTILATTGIPGLLLFLAALVWALVAGARTAFALSRSKTPTGKAAYYVAWFVAATALQVALLVAAVSTPIVLYAFLSLGVLLAPAARPARETAIGRTAPAIVGTALALAVLGTVLPHLSAEVAVARALSGGSLERAGFAAASVPWNIDIQRAYYHLRVRELDAALAAQGADAKPVVTALSEDLARAGEARPFEFYFPSVRTQILTNSGSTLQDAAFAEGAVAAADEALAIMPASIPTRVQKALALSQLQRYTEMADALAGYWENELSSAYPGILYAQAKALSGDSAEAARTFDALIRRFPAEREGIEAARAQVQGK